MRTFIKVKGLDGRLVLLDLSVVEGFYEDPQDADKCAAYYRVEHTPPGKPQAYALLAHSVTEIANAIDAQTGHCEIADLTMDELDEESDAEKPNMGYDREASEI